MRIQLLVYCTIVNRISNKPEFKDVQGTFQGAAPGIKGDNSVKTTMASIETTQGDRIRLLEDTDLQGFMGSEPY